MDKSPKAWWKLIWSFQSPKLSLTTLKAERIRVTKPPNLFFSNQLGNYNRLQAPRDRGQVVLHFETLGS
jgi:hypothetical protein